MEFLKTFSFSSLLAFLLPGFVAEYGLSYLFPTLRTVIQTLTSATEHTTGPVLFFLLAALAIGMAVSTIRSTTWDWACKRMSNRRRNNAPPDEGLDYTTLSTGRRIEAFNLAVGSSYRYYQYAGNMAVALLVLAICRSRGWEHGEFRFAWDQFAIVTTGVALLGASYPQFLNTNNQLRQILIGMKRRDQLRRSIDGDEKKILEKGRKAEE